MERIAYHLAGGLSAAQLERVHEAALRVLAETGVQVENRVLHESLAATSGARAEGARVRLGRDTVELALAEHRAALASPSAADDGFTLDVADGYCSAWLDPATDALRPMTTGDCVRWARLVDALHACGVRGGNPGLPQDVAPALQEVLAYKVSLANSRTPGWPPFTSPRHAEVMLRLATAAGRRLGLSVFALSPLHLAGPTIDLAVEFLARRAPVALGISNMPIAGVSTPLVLPAAFVESVATNLAAFVAFRRLGVDIGIAPAVFPFDMRYGAIAYGTPEHVRSYLLGNQLAAFYNGGHGAWFCPAFETNAVACDAHSLTTRAVFATVGALAGARHFAFGGWLGLDKIFSPGQLLLDVELLDYLRHLVRPMPWADNGLGVDILAEVGPGGSFLTHPSTVAHARDAWSSTLFRSLAPEQRAGPLAADVNTLVRERLTAAEQAWRPAVDPAVVMELERIYQAFAAEEPGP